MHLATTAITEFWNPDDENLLLGPWCAPRGHDDCAAFRQRFLPDPWADRARFESAQDYCTEFSERLIGPLSRHLNTALKTNHSERYWRILVYPWLDYHLQEMYGHYVFLQDAFKLAPTLTTTVMAPASYRIPKDAWEHIRWSFGNSYSLQLFSQLLSDRGFPDKPYDWPASKNEPGISFKSSLKQTASGALSRIIPRAGQVMISAINLSSKENLKIMFGTGFRALPLRIDLPPSLIPSPKFDDRRLGLSSLLAPRDEFERIYLESLTHGLPTAYLEGHVAARAYALSRLWRTPRIVISAGGWHFSEGFKFAAAECAERGSALWGLQHGGGSYGMLRRVEAERMERAVTDRYYVWGWASLDGNPKVRNIPSPQLARVRRTGPGAGLLIVSTAVGLHNIILMRNQSNSRALDYLQRQARLWNALPPKLRLDSRLRLHLELGWRHEERLRETCPDLRLDDSSVSFTRRLAEARLVIVDFPATSFQEALAADAPCLLTWNPADFNFRDTARPFFDRLKTVGLLFDEPEQAAAQAARVYDDPGVWWNEPARREVRRDFVRHFAYRRDDWLDFWLREIEEGLTGIS